LQQQQQNQQEQQLAEAMSVDEVEEKTEAKPTDEVCLKIKILLLIFLTYSVRSTFVHIIWFF
jgi:hypothetical protein